MLQIVTVQSASLSLKAEPPVLSIYTDSRFGTTRCEPLPGKFRLGQGIEYYALKMTHMQLLRSNLKFEVEICQAHLLKFSYFFVIRIFH